MLDTVKSAAKVGDTQLDKGLYEIHSLIFRGKVIAHILFFIHSHNFPCSIAKNVMYTFAWIWIFHVR